MTDAWVECTFHERIAADGGYRYSPVHVRTWSGIALPVSVPPFVGDLVHLDTGGGYRGFRVVDRAWLYPQFGSLAWPTHCPEPLKGPMLTVIVEAAEGPFVREAEDDEIG